MKKKPKILFIWTKNAGVTWYRVIQFADAMAEVGKMKIGFDIDKNEFGDIFYPPWNPNNQIGHQWEMEMGQNLRVATDFFAPLISEADVVIFQTLASQLGYSILASCKDLDKKVLTTIDDIEGHVPYGHIAYDVNQPGSKSDQWLAMQLSASHAVIASTKYLAEKIKAFNQKVYVVPNAINFDLWDKVKKPQSNGVVKIGWAGGASHEPDLAIIEEPCLKIREKYKNEVQFYFIGGPPTWAMDRDGFICKRSIDPGGWANVDHYHHFLASYGFDIGLAPLRDNEFNRAKSNLRWLEYSALKIPTIASDVEPFMNGCKPIGLCSKESDWEWLMRDLVALPKTRKELGNKAYRACKKHYNIKTVAKDFLKIINEVHHGTS